MTAADAGGRAAKSATKDDVKAFSAGQLIAGVTAVAMAVVIGVGHRSECGHRCAQRSAGGGHRRAWCG